ncbi:hypothetical protein GCM10027300_39810 [Modestobacter lapidis]
MEVQERAAADNVGLHERGITVTVNGTVHERTESVRRSLVEFIREDLELTGSRPNCRRSSARRSPAP